MAEPGAIDLGIEGLGPAVRIGSGGFADVYRAEQENLRRQVAVKVVRSSLSDPQSRLRFERECHALGAVSDHPHIVGVHRSGFTGDGRAYLIMTYCPGGSLLDRVHAGGPMAAADVLDVARKVGKALGMAHDAGVLHRDVKPANILMTAFGEPALADFGIARVEGADQTATGQITASFTHAAPEVLQGGAPSVRSDVYSLGSTLYELATGRPGHVHPDDESPWMLIRRASSEPFPDPGSAGIGEPLASIIRRATAFDPADRYPSAAELVADLDRPSAPAAPATVIAGGATPATVLAGPRGSDAAAQPTWVEAADALSATAVTDPASDRTAQVASRLSGAAAPPAHAAPGPTLDRPPRRRRAFLGGMFAVLVVAAVGAGVLLALRGDDAVEVTLAFVDGSSGPLDLGQTYALDVTGHDDAEFELLIDGEPVAGPAALPLAFTPETAGRQALSVRTTRGDLVGETEVIELYVIGELPDAGYRANLASLTDDAANWPATLERFDEFVAEGHTGLELLPSSRFASLRPGFWNLYVPGFGEEQEDGRAYCTDFGLSVPEECFVTFFDPEA
ncbi:MAG: serine/threonine-protein kinase [Actinomycetota bacterium]